MSSLLLKFPEEYSVDLLANWCDLKTLVKTDSAHCHTADRHDFLILVTSCGFVTPSSHNCSGLRYIANRTIKARKIICSTTKSEQPSNLVKLLSLIDVSRLVTLDNSFDFVMGDLSPLYPPRVPCSSKLNIAWIKLINSTTLLQHFLLYNDAQMTASNNQIFRGISSDVLNRLTTFQCGMVKCSTKIWEKVASNLASVQSLSLVSCPSVSSIELLDAIILKFIDNKPDLKNLTLVSNGQFAVMDRTLGLISSKCSGLVTLRLSVEQLRLDIISAMWNSMKQLLSMVIKGLNSGAVFMKRSKEGRHSVNLSHRGKRNELYEFFSVVTGLTNVSLYNVRGACNALIHTITDRNPEISTFTFVCSRIVVDKRNVTFPSIKYLIEQRPGFSNLCLGSVTSDEDIHAIEEFVHSLPAARKVIFTQIPGTCYCGML